MNNSMEEDEEIPHKWLQVILHYLMGLRNDTSVDFSKPHLRPSVIKVYPFFVFLYAILVVTGTISNLAVLATIIRHHLYKDPTYSYMVNLAVADIVKCVLVLPVSLTILLVQNWIFGSFLCFFLPMMQDIPLHVSTLSFLLIALDRYRLMHDPTKPRMPAFVCALGTWLLAVCIVLPYPIYTTYLDLGTFNKQHLEGLGLCAVNLVDDMQEYMRGLFIVMYVLPLAVICYLYVRVSRELKVQEGPLAVMMYEARNRPPDGSSSQDVRAGQEYDRNYDLYEAELDINKEKRTQKYLISMTTIYALCMCPLMVLRLAKLAVMETYANSAHFDITFTMFVWIAFLPTVTTPVLFASWRMSRLAKERLRGYLRFSNRKLRRDPDEGEGAANNLAYSTEQSGIPTTIHH